MAIELNGDSGITTPGLINTGSETVVNLTTTGNTILGDASTDTLNVGNGGLVKDASGNVGIGTASPTVALDVFKTAYPEIRTRSTSYTNTFGIDTASGFGALGSVTNNPFVFVTNNTERMRLDTSGNLGLGVTPSAWGPSTARAIQINSGNNLAAIAGTTNTILGANWYYNGTNDKYMTTNTATCYAQYDGAHQWKIAPSGTAGANLTWTNAMTLDASGNLLVGTTSPILSGRQTTSYNGVTYNGLVLSESANTANTTFISFNNGATSIGSIYRAGATAAVVYLTTSDVRLKSNIVDATPVLDKLMSVKVRQYDWTEGNTHQDYGFIAQELEPVLSGVVFKGKTDADVWGLDYSRLTPHLVKALQEQQAMIDELKAKVAALEAA